MSEALSRPAQIEDAAYKYVYEKYHTWDKKKTEDFIAGAKWADSRPDWILCSQGYPTMYLDVQVALRSIVSGREDMQVISYIADDGNWYDEEKWTRMKYRPIAWKLLDEFDETLY